MLSLEMVYWQGQEKDTTWKILCVLDKQGI